MTVLCFLKIPFNEPNQYNCHDGSLVSILERLINKKRVDRADFGPPANLIYSMKDDDDDTFESFTVCRL